jgi:hypothetical protein
VVGDELKQAAVGIAEVDTDPATLGAKPSNRSSFDFNTLAGQVCHRALDRLWPHETKVAVAGLHRKSGDVARQINARSMHVQLSVTEPVGNARRRTMRDQLRANHVAVEPVRSRSVGYAHNAVVKSNLRCHPRMVFAIAGLAVACRGRSVRRLCNFRLNQVLTSSGRVGACLPSISHG